MNDPGLSETKGGSSFWRTLPGVLAQLAVVIGAVTGLIVALNAAGIIGGSDTDTTVNGSEASTPGTATPPTGDSAGMDEDNDLVSDDVDECPSEPALLCG